MLKDFKDGSLQRNRPSKHPVDITTDLLTVQEQSDDEDAHYIFMHERESESSDESDLL